MFNKLGTSNVWNNAQDTVLLFQIQKKNLLVVITQERKPPGCIWESQRHPQHSRDISSTQGRGTE